MVSAAGSSALRARLAYASMRGAKSVPALAKILDAARGRSVVGLAVLSTAARFTIAGLVPGSCERGKKRVAPAVERSDPVPA